MYYRMRFSSKQAIYTTEEKARQLLLRVYLHIEKQGGTILDYTLLPTLLDLLISHPGGTPRFGFIGHRCTLEYIPNTLSLLPHYKQISATLPEAGRNYPLCGTYEAYHGSSCLCSLGKVGPFTHELTIQTILLEKSSPTVQGSLKMHA